MEIEIIPIEAIVPSVTISNSVDKNCQSLVSMMEQTTVEIRITAFVKHSDES
jgi:hypothetical protein